MRFKNISTALLIPVLAYLIAGCASTHQNTVPGEEIKAQGWEQRGNAFLFDITVNRDGKKNSARLDLYQRGDSLSFFARGYLGKGALKGLLSADSVVVYFPTAGEYYGGRLGALLADTCGGGQNLEQLLLDMFRELPTMSDLPSDLSLKILEDGKRLKRFELVSTKCPARMGLRYDFRDKQFILSYFDFATSDNSFRFEAERRNYRLNIKIPEDKFQINIPETAARIYPR